MLQEKPFFLKDNLLQFKKFLNTTYFKNLVLKVKIILIKRQTYLD